MSADWQRLLKLAEAIKKGDFMAREIEIKLPLTEEEYKKLYSAIFGKSSYEGIQFLQADQPEHLFKQDTYYSRYDSHEERVKMGEPRVIRIRSEENLQTKEKKAYFCIKYKSVENGIELNSENESFVQDQSVIEKLLLLSGYKTYFDKKKDAFSIYCKTSLNPSIKFHLELEEVNGLKYVEIEETDSDLPAEEIRKALEGLVIQLGLDPLKKDARSWMEIINQQKN